MADWLNSIGYQHWILTALLIIPMAGAAVVWASPAKLAKYIALAVTVIEFIVSVGMWFQFNPMGDVQFERIQAWVGSYGIFYHVGVDGISLMMVLLTTLLMPLAVLGSWQGVTTKVRGFYGLLLVLTTGMIGVFVALDLFLFYVLWEVMLIPMYFIIGIWGGKSRLYASLKFFIYTMVGSLLMLVAILYLFFQAGRNGSGVYSFDYQYIMTHLPNLPFMTQFWLFGAFALAFAIKVPMVPFHTWLPDAHTEAPTAGSVILAGILLKMGTYGFIRFAVPLFPSVAFHPQVSAVVIGLAVVGIVYGALVAMVQPDFKRLVAYSSVSHLGFVMLGLWALTVQGVQGALMVMISHGVSTGALFLLIGMIYERRHSRLIADFGGIAAVMPAFATMLTVVALSSVGLPGSNGFIGEFLVLLGSFQTHPVAATIATTAVIFAAAYLLWALKRVLYGPITSDENRALTDLTPREYLVLAPLIALILWIGLYPQPILRRMDNAAKTYVQMVQMRMGDRPDMAATERR
jgi:NADH-quinone oxidoreductase subunit M